MLPTSENIELTEIYELITKNDFGKIFLGLSF
jgi:hypothetical protein